MEKMLVFGHKSPDTDTICSAIVMSDFQKKLGKKVKPVRLGELNKETKFALNYFGFEYVYENFIGEDTKSNYSKKEIEDLFNNENSYFNRAAFIDLIVTNSSDYAETTYEFKDRKMNEYKITESGTLNLKIDFIIVPEEEIVNEDGGGLLEIIQQ